MSNNEPRLNFAPDLVESILLGTKTATTRLADECDPNSDLDQIVAGTKCIATTQQSNETYSFAKLNVNRVELVKFEAIDISLARLENCSTSDELKLLIKRFYKDVEDNTMLKVIYFNNSVC